MMQARRGVPGRWLRWLLLGVCMAASGLFAGEAVTPLAPGYTALPYQPPKPGSYRLPPLGEAADGEVIDEQGKRVRLHQLFGDQYVLMTFMYSHCSDANGCPLTAYVFHRLYDAMGDDKELRNNLRLVSISFDPEHDTPKMLASYAHALRGTGPESAWRFATSESTEQLAPLLRAYSQDVQQRADDSAIDQADFSHILRVFLIDPEKKIRNIYSAAFLHETLIRNDLKTLIASRESGAAAYSGGVIKKTNSVEKSKNLLLLAKQPPLGLPPLPIGDVLTSKKVALGKKLFFDRRLSLNRTISCAMCHVPEQGFTSNETATAVGIEGRTVRRNSPTLLNVGYAHLLFHDGRENRLEQQVWGPLLAKNEMGNPAVGTVMQRIESLHDYDGLFEKAFDGKAASMETIGKALAAYQMTLNAANSRFDRWRYGNDPKALNAKEQYGYRIFTGKAGCSSCHLIGEYHALFSDDDLHNTGVGYRNSMGVRESRQQVQLAPGVLVQVPQQIIAKVSEPPPADLGRYEITEAPDDRWKYKTPTLRNIALTAPYMHDGSLSTLAEVIDFYDAGGVPNPLLDPRIRPLHLNSKEKAALEAFLRTLTGDNIAAIIKDAREMPIGDTGI